MVWEVRAPTLLRMGPLRRLCPLQTAFLSGRPGAKGTTRRASQQSLLRPGKHPAVLSTALEPDCGFKSQLFPSVREALGKTERGSLRLPVAKRGGPHPREQLLDQVALRLSSVYTLGSGACALSGVALSCPRQVGSSRHPREGGRANTLGAG